uniref:Uncharacterized protein n=1 Tax=Ditylum brightwellii TaxID=49249 RepID=A0A7S1ZBZ3_9STRA
MPGITESPLQITPSQSKINTSTPSNISFSGSVNFNTLALRLVVVVELNFEKEETTAGERIKAREEAAGVNADADVRVVAKAVRANRERFMMMGKGCVCVWCVLDDTFIQV